jgi:hypothetical protein
MAAAALPAPMTMRGGDGGGEQVAQQALRIEGHGSVLLFLEPVQSLLRVGPAALKAGSDCSFTARKLRILACFCLAWL